MLDKGFFPNSIIYTSLIDGLFKQGNMIAAFKLGEEMIKKGFMFDVVTYNVFINGLKQR